MQVLESFDLDQTIVVKFEFDEIGAEIKANDLFNEVVSQVKGFEIGWINCMLLDGSDSATNVIDFLFYGKGVLKDLGQFSRVSRQGYTKP